MALLLRGESIIGYQRLIVFIFISVILKIASECKIVEGKIMANGKYLNQTDR